MSSVFIPNPDTAAHPAEAAPIDAGGWYPPLDLDLFRREQRIDKAVTDARVRQALIAALVGVLRDLASWQARQSAASLADCASHLPPIDGQNALVLLFRRAVFTAAKAELVERYRDADLTPAGQRNADALGPSIDELRRDSIHAVRDILNVGRTTVELI